MARGDGAFAFAVWQRTERLLGREWREATALHDAIPLVHGLTYRVSVAYIVGGDGIAASGQEIFTF